LVIIIGIVIYIIHLQINKNNKNIVINNKNEPNPLPLYNSIIPSYPYNNLPPNVLQNPYVPPLSDNRYFIQRPVSIPINVSTNIGAVDTEYRQMGILTPLNGPNKDNILALMGRPLFVNRQKFQYYTISNQHNNVKLPIIFKKKNGLNDYGVDQIYNGDVVYVEGYQHSFKATIYENDTIRYLPFL
jgi:hypothetical protein